LKAALKKRYADLASMEDIVRSSGLDWTIIRPPQLVDKPPKGRYRTAHGLNLPGGRSISRADVAHLMLQVVGQRGTIKEIVGVAY
jgi:uncharacterized protein YbjT (DUF2867 family)